MKMAEELSGSTRMYEICPWLPESESEAETLPKVVPMVSDSLTLNA